MTSAVHVRAPAKINLGLSVGPRRIDGYHDLATVFHAVSLTDEIRVSPGTVGRGVTITVTGATAGTPVSGVPTGSDNLAARAAIAIAERCGRVPDVHVDLVKAIPVAGGMAGGSADAAGVLVALDALWRLGLSRDELADIAAELGSDVPFALHGGTVVGMGRGERLTPLLARGEFHWVVALSEGGLSTPAVYAECDRLRGDGVVPPPRLDDALLQALRVGDAAAVGPALANDLQAAALSLRPGLRLVLETGLESGALGGIVSGSGPTCVFLARDRDAALDLAVTLSASGVVAGVRHVTGPAPGARVI